MMNCDILYANSYIDSVGQNIESAKAQRFESAEARRIESAKVLRYKKNIKKIKKDVLHLRIFRG